MITNILSKIKTSIPPSDNNRLIILGVSAAILLIIIIIIVVIKNIKYKKENPIFFQKGKDANQADFIPSNRLYTPRTGYNMSWGCWLYINDWNYKIGEWKHVLSRGIEPCPGIWISKNINNLSIVICTIKSFENIKLKNIPIKRWTQIMVVVNTLEVDVYLDGKLVITHILKSFPKINNGNLYVNNSGGFHGEIRSVCYFPKALSANAVYKIYKKGPSALNIIQKIINKIYISGKALGLMRHIEPGSNIISPTKKCKK